jgi:multiple sugar transport system permease protein
MTTVVTPELLEAEAAAPRKRRPTPWGRIAMYVFLSIMAIVWLFPLGWAIYTALRPYSDTQAAGYISLPQTLNFQNFIDAWNGGDFARRVQQACDRAGSSVRALNLHVL